MSKQLFEQYEAILLSELLPALGCTEPIAIALAVSQARKVLGRIPDRIDLYCSGNIIKNVRAVVIPNSGGKKGLEIAAALGLYGGNPDLLLEVLSEVNEIHREQACQYVKENRICVHHVKDEPNLYLRCEAFSGDESSLTEIKYDHTHFNRIEKNGEVLFSAGIETIDDHHMDLSCLNLKNIYEFAETWPINDEAHAELKAALDRQIEYNQAIGQEGINHAHGAEIGRITLFSNMNHLVEQQCIAYAAAGSDARMSGCGFPVVINSGSGNQGMTVSIPLIIYATEMKLKRERLYRALMLANLVAIHQKRFIGKLSAFCGVVSASAAAGAGLAYLMNLNFEQICKVITNTLATSGGMVCDGAKPSCAAKIAVSLNNAMMGINMARMGKSFEEGDGIVGKNAEATIRNVGRMARVGMSSTDEEILNIMIHPGCCDNDN